MILDNRNNPYVFRALSHSKRLCMALLSMVVLCACGQSHTDLEKIYAELDAPTAWSRPPSVQLVDFESQIPATIETSPGNLSQQNSLRVAGMLPIPYIPSKKLAKQKYWSFPSEDSSEDSQEPQLIRLPPVDETNHDEPNQKIAQLMPPQSITPDQLLLLPSGTDENSSAGSEQ